MDILSKLHTNRIAVNNIRLMTLDDLKAVVEPHLHLSGFRRGDSYLQLVIFGATTGGHKISYKNDELEFEIEGFTEDGVIVGGYGAGLQTRDYNDLSFEETAYALEVALAWTRGKANGE